MLRTIGLLLLSNVFMTLAWYWHLNHKEAWPLWKAISISWFIALFEYCFQVPANRVGSETMTTGQLKVLQEVITMIVFPVFCVFVRHEPIRWNFFAAFVCLLGAVYFMFNFDPVSIDVTDQPASVTAPQTASDAPPSP